MKLYLLCVFLLIVLAIASGQSLTTENVVGKSVAVRPLYLTLKVNKNVDLYALELHTRIPTNEKYINVIIKVAGNGAVLRGKWDSMEQISGMDLRAEQQDDISSVEETRNWTKELTKRESRDSVESGISVETDKEIIKKAIDKNPALIFYLVLFETSTLELAIYLRDSIASVHDKVHIFY